VQDGHEQVECHRLTISEWYKWRARGRLSEGMGNVVDAHEEVITKQAVGIGGIAGRS